MIKDSFVESESFLGRLVRFSFSEKSPLHTWLLLWRTIKLWKRTENTNADLKWQVLSPYRSLDAELNRIQMPFNSPFNMSFFRTGNFLKWGVLADWTLFFHLTTYLPCLMLRNTWNCFHTCSWSSKTAFLLAPWLCCLISLFKWRIIHLSHCYDIKKEMKESHWLFRMTHSLHPSFASSFHKMGLNLYSQSFSLFLIILSPVLTLLPHAVTSPRAMLGASIMLPSASSETLFLLITHNSTFGWVPICSLCLLS